MIDVGSFLICLSAVKTCEESTTGSVRAHRIPYRSSNTLRTTDVLPVVSRQK